MVSLLDIDIRHHFGGGVYIKDTIIPAGIKLTQHKHKFDHLSYLCSGDALVEVEGRFFELHGPAHMVIEAGKVHEVTAATECRWLCIHAIEATTATEADRELIA